MRKSLFGATALLLVGLLIGAEAHQVVLRGLRIYTPIEAQAEVVPTDAILFFRAGSCPTGYTEVDITGSTIVGTTNAAGNVGGTGGSDTITPAGTVAAPTLTMNAYTPAGTNSTVNFTPAGTNQALTFTGTASSCVVNHLHTLATGTGSTGNFSQVVGTVDTSSGGNGGTPTQTALGTLSGNPTANGAATCTPAGTINTPTFTGTQAAVSAQTFTGTQATLTGTNSAPAFTGTQFDNRQAFVRWIPCEKD